MIEIILLLAYFGINIFLLICIIATDSKKESDIYMEWKHHLLVLFFGLPMMIFEIITEAMANEKKKKEINPERE